MNKDTSIQQKKTETSLIEQFMYPKLGPGQLWEEVARRIEEKGGEIHLRHKVVGLKWRGDKVTGIVVQNEEEKSQRIIQSDYVFSTMPVQELIQGMTPPAAPEVIMMRSTEIPMPYSF